MQEKRIFERLEHIANIRYKFQSGKEWKNALSIKNVSGGGIQLSLSEKLNLGAIIDIEIFLPHDKNPIPAVGKIIWIKEADSIVHKGEKYFKTGVNFIKVDLISLGRVTHVIS